MVDFLSWTADRGYPWALVSHPLSAMTSAEGAAYADFLFEAGDGDVGVLIAPDDMDPMAGAGAVGGQIAFCGMRDGWLWLDGSTVRGETPGWGAAIAPGETVRVRYVAATRMVSIVWRGREYDLAPIPWDLSHHRLGVRGRVHNRMRLTGASVPGVRARVAPACVFRPELLCAQSASDKIARFATSLTCEVSSRALGSRRFD